MVKCLQSKKQCCRNKSSGKIAPPLTFDEIDDKIEDIITDATVINEDDTAAVTQMMMEMRQVVYI